MRAQTKAGMLEQLKRYEAVWAYFAGPPGTMTAKACQ
jgi:hypothetical protein